MPHFQNLPGERVEDFGKKLLNVLCKYFLQVQKSWTFDKISLNGFFENIFFFNFPGHKIVDF